jgi:hypothetical protein
MITRLQERRTEVLPLVGRGADDDPLTTGYLLLEGEVMCLADVPDVHPLEALTEFWSVLLPVSTQVSEHETLTLTNAP